MVQHIPLCQGWALGKRCPADVAGVLLRVLACYAVAQLSPGASAP